MLRRSRDPQDFTVLVANFTPVPRPAYRVGVPESGWYREVLNSDAEIYGGGNVGNGGGVLAEDHPAHGFDHSLSLDVPPLGFLLLKR
jgi:1,4-alpha-glucan branching enzyme